VLRWPMQTSKRLGRLSMRTMWASLCLSPEQDWSLAPKLEGLPAYRAAVPLWTYAKPQGRCFTAIPRHACWSANLHYSAAVAAKCGIGEGGLALSALTVDRGVLCSQDYSTSLLTMLFDWPWTTTADTAFPPMMAQEYPPKLKLEDSAKQQTLT